MLGIVSNLFGDSLEMFRGYLRNALGDILEMCCGCVRSAGVYFRDGLRIC